MRKYVANMDKARDLDAISELQLRHEDTLGKLRAGYPELIQQIDEATEAAKARVQ